MTTLTEAEQKRSLSQGKRKRHEKAAKVVLCNPFKKYWPVVNEEDAKEIEILLKSLLSVLFNKDTKPKIPWKKLVKLPKEIRKKRIEELKPMNTTSEDVLCHRKYVKLGLNSVSRAIQHSQITTCLLAGDVKPNLVIEHVVTLASTRGIPLLIIPKLKNIATTAIGFSCTALGILVNETNQYFKSLNEMILKISLQFPLPVNYGCFLRRNQNLMERRKKKVVRDKSEPSVSTDLNNEHTNSVLDYIPLNVKQNSKNVDTALSKIQYIFPSFKRMPCNPNKARKRKNKKKNNK